MSGFTMKSVLTIKPESGASVGKLNDPATPGLYLFIRGKSRSWIFRYMRQGKAKEISLGSLRTVSLQEARDKIITMRAALITGQPVTAPAPVQTAPVISFKQDALTWHARKTPGWDDLYARKVIKALELHVFDKIGATATDSLTACDIKAVISPLWTSAHVTARNVLGWVSNIVKHAAHVRGFAPVAAETVLAHLDDIKKPDAIHRTAVCWKAAPALFTTLAGMDTMASKALRLLILTGTPRAAEIIGMDRSEIDGAVWHCPPERLKSGNPAGLDRPLTGAALDIIATLPASGPLFPGMGAGAMQKVLKSLDGGMTHGLRATFRTWASEHATTVQDHDAAEINLDHKIGNRVHRAYDRADMLPQRRTMLDRWSGFLTA